MAYQIMPVEFPGGSQLDKIGVRFKRADGKVYDTADKTFKLEANCVAPFLPLVAGTKSDLTLLASTVELNPAQWTDGDYRCYFHNIASLSLSPLPADPSLPIVSECAIQIWAGQWRTYNPTDIAGRVLDGTVATHKTKGSVGAWMTAVNSKLDYLCAQIAKTSGTTPPPLGF